MVCFTLDSSMVFMAHVMWLTSILTCLRCAFNQSIRILSADLMAVCHSLVNVGLPWSRTCGVTLILSLTGVLYLSTALDRTSRWLEALSSTSVFSLYLFELEFFCSNLPLWVCQFRWWWCVEVIGASSIVFVRLRQSNVLGQESHQVKFFLFIALNLLLVWQDGISGIVIALRLTVCCLVVAMSLPLLRLLLLLEVPTTYKICFLRGFLCCYPRSIWG